MKENERSIVRKRTQQLVYLELGRDNGGVMLNLSEEGCGFQAISPVNLGRVRFAFQISGARRISGEAEVEWLDEAGIMGGLRFLDLNGDARKQIRRWLDDTNAPEELGDGVARAASSLGATAQTARTVGGQGVSAATSRSSAVGVGTRVLEAEPPAPPWTHMPLHLPVLEEERNRFPLLRGDGSFGGYRRRSAGLWRGILVLGLLVGLGGLVVTHQQEVGTYLIWLGETLAGKGSTSVGLPEAKPMQALPPAPETSSPSDAAEEAKPAPDATPEKGLAAAPANQESSPEQSDPMAKAKEAPQSVLEQQSAQQKVEPPRMEGETVESLWEAVKGGSVAAEMSLAERFVRGDGVARNCDQARVLMRAAANKGNKEARLRLYELESGACRP